MNTFSNVTSDSNAAFWTNGNFPTQRVNHLASKQIERELIALYLLADKINAAASFYLESEVTRIITLNNLSLFSTGEIAFFLDNDLEDAVDHAKKKISKNPVGTRYHSDKKEVLEHAAELDTLNLTSKRPKISISDRMVNLWIRDLTTTSEGSIGNFLASEVDSVIYRMKVTDLLVFQAENRVYDFVWEYIYPILKNKFELPSTVYEYMRKRLSEIYCEATCEVIGSQPEHNIFKGYSDIISTSSKYEPRLFLECCKILGIDEAILSLTNDQLISLKKRPEFQFFRQFYFTFIDAVSFDQLKLEKCLLLLQKSEMAYLYGKVNKQQFLINFYLTTKTIGIPSKVTKSLDHIIFVVDNFNTATIRDFITSVEALSKIPGTNTVLLETVSTDFQLLINMLREDIMDLIVMQDQQHENMLNQIYSRVESILARSELEDIVDSNLNQARVIFSSPDISIKNKLLFTIPIIPAILRHEVELSFEGKGQVEKILRSCLDKISSS